MLDTSPEGRRHDHLQRIANLISQLNGVSAERGSKHGFCSFQWANHRNQAPHYRHGAKRGAIANLISQFHRVLAERRRTHCFSSNEERDCFHHRIFAEVGSQSEASDAEGARDLEDAGPDGGDAAHEVERDRRGVLDEERRGVLDENRHHCVGLRRIQVAVGTSKSRRRWYGQMREAHCGLIQSPCLGVRWYSIRIICSLSRNV